MDTPSSVIINLAVIGTLVMTSTQLLKRIIPGDGYGPYIAAVMSFIGVIVWMLSNATVPLTDPSTWFPVLAAWVAVWQIAAGSYGVANMVTNVGTLTTTTQVTAETAGAIVDRSPVMSPPVAAPVVPVASTADTSQSPAGLILPDSTERSVPGPPAPPVVPITLHG